MLAENNRCITPEKSLSRSLGFFATYPIGSHQPDERILASDLGKTIAPDGRHCKGGS
jgi:hypothetical protein